MKLVAALIIILAGVLRCQKKVEDHGTQQALEVTADSSHYQINIPSGDILYDKILGSLVGSAIGDAMGAPTEMWDRKQRQTSYGYIEALDPSFIDPSPEGLWGFNLPPGTTTDDTRWKYLAGHFVSGHISSFYLPQGPDPFVFSQYIVDSYRDQVTRLKETPGFDPENIEDNMRRLSWLQEWAQVAEPYSKKDLEGYTGALHRFYGGELLCAGMLYAPALALPYPGDPEKAYAAAYRLGIFDQGYARDITGLTAALVAAAMSSGATTESIMEVFHTVDPNNYFRRRLFGRIAFRTFQEAQRISQSARSVSQCERKELTIPVINQDTLRSCRMQQAFSLLDQRNQDTPAHAQEILLVSLTAMLYSDFDFQDSMEFITNYGRDNDTSGAVAGAILGAYHGFQKLPEASRNQVLETNRNHLGIDLEDLARQLTESIIAASTASTS